MRRYRAPHSAILSTLRAGPSASAPWGEDVCPAYWPHSAPPKKEPVIAVAIVGPSRFSLSVTSDAGHAVVALHGELDIATTETVHGAVAELRRTGSEDVVLDLRGLTFMDGTGLQLLLVLRNDAMRAHHSLTLVPGPADVQRIFALTSTLGLFDWRRARLDSMDRLMARTRTEHARLRRAEQRRRLATAALGEPETPASLR